MTDSKISSAALRIIKLMIGHPPMSIADLIRKLGVTRTAISEQLNELMLAGFIDREVEEINGRGRPRHLFRPTEAALLLLFAQNQRLVFPLVWRSIEELAGEEMVQKVMHRVSEKLAEYYNTKITARKPSDRLRQLMQVLQDEGSLIEIEMEKGQLSVYKRNCPFVSMVDDHRDICTLDQEMMSTVVGKPVRRTACRHEGAACCVFELDKES